ncbi:NTP transferase domain-containing protein [Leifsonia sp. F6_8S_P_1B]|uniref:NTP transferase domain-containing protein n=1 Tax=Leifsonia williamsii TaxID=3035919 RepID=A0ABT8K752_9MICO|nr:NTP transferase domain-containing protein [Leifsonia williamsii]MDN4613266.1 NTP transferase domain-containing protein [Leifsonia williamsii]
MTAAIVLAGGRSSRFGSDKLEAVVDGRSLLTRAVEAAVEAGCDPVVVVTAREVVAGEASAGGASPFASEAVDDAEAAGRVVTVSEWPRWGGPCAAVAAGVEALGTSTPSRDLAPTGRVLPGGPLARDDVLILPADLADPAAAVAALAVSPGPCVLRDADGREQWLLARASVAALRARLDGLRAEATLADLPARALLGGLPVADPALSPLITADIDRPADLDLLKELSHGTV